MYDLNLHLFDDPEGGTNSGTGGTNGGNSGTSGASESTGNAAEGVLGKQIVYLFRVFKNRATATGAVVAFTTENEHSISADGDSTATKDGALQKPGVVTVEITGTAIVLKGDETLGEQLRDACLNNDLVECWEADLSNPRSEGKYAGTYYQGYLTEWNKTSNAEDYAEHSYTFAANGTGAPDGGSGVTVTAEQQAIASYVFADTTATGA